MATYTGPLRENYGRYFDVDKEFENNPRARANKYWGESQLGEKFGELRDGYSFVPHQDAPDPVAYTQARKGKKGGGFDYGEKRYIYKKVDSPKPQAQEAPAQEAPAQPEPEKEPLPPRGSTFTDETQRYRDTRLQNPGNQAPRMGYTNDPYRDAISHGEDLNAHYTNKFIPSLQAEARLTGEEIGESGRFNIARFIGKVPELGEPKDLFAYYSDKLKESA